MDDLPLPVVQETKKIEQTSRWVRRWPPKSRRWEFQASGGGLRQTGGFCVLQSFRRLGGPGPMALCQWKVGDGQQQGTPGAADAGRRRPFLLPLIRQISKRTGGASPMSPPSKWELSRGPECRQEGKPSPGLADHSEPSWASELLLSSRFRSFTRPWIRQQAPNIGLISSGRRCSYRARVRHRN